MTTPGVPISVGDFLARISTQGELLISDPSYGSYDSWEVTAVSIDNSDPNYSVATVTCRQKTDP